jgi:hypothetical protein
MGTCPCCQFENPNQAAHCEQCGGDLFVLAAITLSTPLPLPMTEPINTPLKPPPDSKPLPARPALTASIGEEPAIGDLRAATGAGEIDLESTENLDFPTMDSNPIVVEAKLTVQNFSVPATMCQTQDRPATGGTVPARPGLISEHTMNDAALESPTKSTTPALDQKDSSATPLPPACPPKLLVLRGLKIGAEFPIYEGRNTIGRFADKPVDIDLLNQESVEQVWCSRQHAAITLNNGIVFIEDLNSLNKTWVNGTCVHVGQQRQLKPGDIIQIGTVQMKLVAG